MNSGHGRQLQGQFVTVCRPISLLPEKLQAVVVYAEMQRAIHRQKSLFSCIVSPVLLLFSKSDFRTHILWLLRLSQFGDSVFIPLVIFFVIDIFLWLCVPYWNEWWNIQADDVTNSTGWWCHTLYTLYRFFNYKIENFVWKVWKLIAANGLTTSIKQEGKRAQ